MPLAATSLIIGYHGCDRQVGEEIVSGRVPFTHSRTKHDWLGRGIYFWEQDERRALEWAQWKQSMGQCPDPYVIGAIFDTGKCLDLLVRENLDLLTATYEGFVAAAGDRPLPENRDSPKGASQNKVMRYLDCAVLNFLHDTMEANGEKPFDSVRGLFVEGDPVYPGAQIFRLTHAQYAILNDRCIKGIFHVKNN